MALTLGQMRREIDEIKLAGIEAAEWLAGRVAEFEQRVHYRPRPRWGWMRLAAATADVVQGQVLDMIGCDLRAFNANGPVLLWHEEEAVPVGRARMFVDDDRERLIADVKFARTRKGREIKRAYRDGRLNAVSLGARHLDYAMRPDGVVHVTWWRPLELSVATVPANPAAVRIR